MKNPYEVLGVDKNVKDDELKKIFRKKAKLLHPDTTTDEKKKKKLEEKFKELNEAYDILSDPRKKADYDNPTSQFHPNVNDIFAQFFNKNMGMPGGFHFNFNGNQGFQSFHQVINIGAEISIITLILGGFLNVTLPSGKTKKLLIPAGTQPATKLRLRENDNIEIVVNLIPIIPELTDEQREQMKKIFKVEEVKKS